MAAPSRTDPDLARILVVDDHDENILALESILSAPGHEIVRARSGAEALRHVLKQDFAVILLDVLMPIMDGFETARLIRGRDASRATPIIFLTAAGSDQDMVAAGYGAGAVDYLIKPLNPAFVRAKVAVFVDLYRKSCQIRRQEEALRAAERDRNQALLAGVSQILLRSLDRDTVVADVTQLIAASMADWCLIATVGPDSDADVKVSVAHWDPSLSGVADALAQALANNPAFQASLRGGSRSVVPSTLAETVDRSWAPDQDTWGLMRRLGAGAVILAPLMVRDQVRGQMALVSAHPTKRFTPADVSTCNDLAHRISLGLENARLYEEAQDAVRARDEFLSIASHELRTPITTLQIHFHRLIRGKAKDIQLSDRLRHVLERCDRQVRRLEALIDHLLDVSRVSSGGLKLERQNVDLTEIVREVSDRFVDELNQNDNHLVLQADERAVGHWDRLRLEQLVTNLLSNAIKYGSGKPIEVKVQPTPTGGRLEVRDHGVGIEAAELPRIFRKFQRAYSARPNGGLGLGLYISRQIVEAHGGSIVVESAPGEGATFKVELPRTSTERITSVETTPQEAQIVADHGTA
jgi:signal transduction histidine kinase/CheY-like chemotaxis protein